jgi:hypothetical protein
MEEKQVTNLEAHRQDRAAIPDIVLAPDDLEATDFVSEMHKEIQLWMSQPRVSYKNHFICTSLNFLLSINRIDSLSPPKGMA